MRDVYNKPEWGVACPKCKAREGTSCVYLKAQNKWVTHWTGNRRRLEYLQVHKTGDPTDRSHNERLTLWKFPTTKPLAVMGLSPAVAAYWDADRREYHAMREWLRANVSILLVSS